MQDTCPIWQKLQNVREFDVTDHSRKHEVMPMKLFTKATSVRLSGVMDLGLARSLLHSIDPAKLVSLTLDKPPRLRKGTYQYDYI